MPCQVQGQSVRLAVGAAVPARPGRRQTARAVVEALHQPGQLAALVAGLGEERSSSHRRSDTEARHPAMQRTNKNAGLRAGVRKYLQQLLLGNQHRYSPVTLMLCYR